MIKSYSQSLCSGRHSSETDLRTSGRALAEDSGLTYSVGVCLWVAVMWKSSQCSPRGVVLLRFQKHNKLSGNDFSVFGCFCFICVAPSSASINAHIPDGADISH